MIYSNQYFEWDRDKAASNAKKHKVNFEEVMPLFNDPFATTYFDEENSLDEERWITVGMSKTNVLCLVVYTFRVYDAYTSIRIISARKLTKRETKSYT